MYVYKNIGVKESKHTYWRITNSEHELQNRYERYKEKNQRVQPQKRKKKQSVVTKANVSRAVTRVHNTSSKMEKTTHLKLCKLHPLVKYDKLNSGHRKTGVGLGRGNPKFGHRKTDVDHRLLI